MTEQPELLKCLRPSELDCVRLAACGLLDKEIAYRRRVSEQTVKAQLQAARDALGVKNRLQLSLVYWGVTPEQIEWALNGEARS